MLEATRKIEPYTLTNKEQNNRGPKVQKHLKYGSDQTLGQRSPLDWYNTQAISNGGEKATHATTQIRRKGALAEIPDA